MKGDELFRRVKAARMWLEKAEQSYGNESSLKGELNLMLALAEMQKLKERRGTERNRFKQHAAALLAAVFLVAGAGAWYWWDANPREISPPPVAESATVQQQTVATQDHPADPPATAQTEPAPVAEPQAVTETTAVSQEPAPVHLTDAELHAVVSDAGRVLRGKE